MTTISFKAKDELKETLEFLAQQKGINVSAYIKLLLTEALKEELGQITENGLTIAEEIAILHSELNDEIAGPFTTVSQLKKALTE